MVLMAFMHDALALGLGNASVDSYLNQPLRAKIALTSRADEDLSTITASLASADDFALIGASLESIPVPLSFSVKQEAEGSYILVSSNLPVRDPVIRLIVEVNWAKGRMLREYTLFLDPPAFTAPAPSPIVSKERAAESVSRSEPPARSTAESEPQADNSLNAGGTGEYGPVQSGETLWRIASRWSQGTGLSVNASMLAIQRNNPQAFIKGNVNLLKQGAILRLPEYSEVAQISAEAARSEILQQSQSVTQPGVQPESSTAVETPLVDESSNENVTASETAPGGQTDQLELVPPAKATDEDSTYGVEESVSEAGASTAVESLREELARKEEELIAQQQENQYLQERLQEMEATLATGEEGTVADKDLAKLEEDLRQKRQSTDRAEGPDAAATSVETPETAQAAPPQTPKVAATKREQSWFSSGMAWLVGLLVVAAAAGGWIMSRRGKQPAAVTNPAITGKAQTVKGIKAEAETILKVLDPASRPGPDRRAPESGAEELTELPPRVPTSRKQDEAEFLDEDSADPEVRLDLARAYIAMGDREAARVILAEVIEHGSDQQKAESQTMLAAL
jgi:pilus assembly protein FimV